MSLPADVVLYKSSPTDVKDNLFRVIPSQTSAFTVGTSQYKLKVELPNLRSIRMSQMIFECDISANFSSTNGGDNWAAVVPTFCGPIASILNRWTLFFGSSTFCDNYTNDLRFNMQYWLRHNSINELDDLYLYPNGLAPASAVTTTRVRFPLTWDPDDFGHLKQGILPLGILPKATMDLYFNPAANCMYYTGSPAGTITLNYTVSNYQFWFEEVESNEIAKITIERPLQFSYMEWYWQQQAIPASQQSVIITLPQNFRWVHHVIAVFRKTSDLTSLTNGNKLKYTTGDLTEVTKANIRWKGQLRYNENLTGSVAMVYEAKKVLPFVRYSDYYQSPTTNATTHAVYALRIGNCISPDRESGVDASSVTSPITLEITWNSALGAYNYQCDFFICHSRYVTIPASGLPIINE